MLRSIGRASRDGGLEKRKWKDEICRREPGKEHLLGMLILGNRRAGQILDVTFFFSTFNKLDARTLEALEAAEEAARPLLACLVPDYVIQRDR